MADNKSRVGIRDRALVSLSEQYEVKYFASKHRISMADAREIIQKAGGSREKANALAEASRGGH